MQAVYIPRSEKRWKLKRNKHFFHSSHNLYEFSFFFSFIPQVFLIIFYHHLYPLCSLPPPPAHPAITTMLSMSMSLIYFNTITKIGPRNNLKAKLNYMIWVTMKSSLIHRVLRKSVYKSRSRSCVYLFGAFL